MTIPGVATAQDTPAAPTNFTGRANSSKVTLNWTAPSGNLTGYTLYRGTGSACNNLTSLQTGIASSATSADDTTVTSDSTYCYQISASNSTGEGTRSSSATVKAVTVGKPTRLRATNTTTSSISLSWTAPADDSGGTLEAYNVYQCDNTTTPGCTPAWVAWVTTGTTYTHSGLTNGSTYRYGVAAYRVSEGAWSNQITATAETVTKPAAPTGFGGRANSSKVVLSWTAPAGVISSYTLYRGTGNACNNLTSLRTGIAFDATSAEDTTATAGSTYCYQITATNSAGEGTRSSSVTVKAVTVGKPTRLRATNTTTSSISLSWTAPADDSGGTLEAYNVYQCDNTTTPGCTPAWVAWVTSGTTYTHSGLTNGSTYRYGVAAYRVSEGAWSNQITATAETVTKPAAPTGFGAQADSSKVVLGWTAPAGVISSYTLYRGTGNACNNLTSLRTGIAFDATSAEDTTATAGSTYCYQITATNSAGEGTRSSSATVKAVTVGKPTRLRATNTTTSSISLSWTAPADDSGGTLEAYNVYQCDNTTTPGCTPAWVAWVTSGTTYTHSGLTQDSTYRYAVAAYRVSEGAWSNQITATAETVTAPAAPTEFGGRVNGSKVVLTWTPPSGVISSYTLYRGTGSACNNLTSLRTGIAFDAASAEDTTVAEGGTYCYQITATNSAGEGARSSNAAVTLPIRPGNPTGLRAKSSATKVALSWTAPTYFGDATHYSIYRDPGDSCTGIRWLARVSARDGTYFEDATVTAGETYCYQVTASNSAGKSGYTNPAVVTALTPAAPVGLLVTSTGNTAIELRWSAPPKDGGGELDGYNLFRCEEGETACSPEYYDWIPQEDGTSYGDRGVTQGETYRYAVGSSRVNGLSDWSNEVTATAQSPVTPDSPSRLSGRANASRAVLDWTASGGDGEPFSYNIYRGDSDDCTGLQIVQSDLPASDTDAEDTTVLEGQAYCYQVTAVNSAGESPHSGSAIVKAVAPAPPTGLRVTKRSTGANELRWMAPIDNGGGAVDGYNIRRCEQTGEDDCEPRHLAEVEAVTTYTDEDVKPEANYQYAISSFRLKGAGRESSPTEVVTAMPHRPMVWLFPRSDDAVRQGFARVINHSSEGGRINITAIDDAGTRHGPVALSIGAGETVHFNSDDLESGNAAKGLPDGVGSGQGDWRLALETTLDLEALSYIRTNDGFLTAMHDVAPMGPEGLRVVTFNPASNASQVSRLRLINPGDAAAEVAITGVDDAGASPGQGVRVSVPAGESVTLAADALESGSGLEGSLGDGKGKWRLAVSSGTGIVAMSLLENVATGHLTNLSTIPPVPGDGVHSVPLFPAASDASGRQGFARVVNRSGAAGEVRVQAYDESDTVYEALTLSLDAGETAHFNSDDLELGNAAKGLTGSTGAGTGDWRLELTSALALEVFSYIRTADGFLTAMHDTAPLVEDVYRVVTLNPGSNVNQASTLRLVNAGARTASATVRGIDDAGESPGGAVRLTVPGGAVRAYTAADLEAGGEGFEGALGDGGGKWRLHLATDEPLAVMSLLVNPTGHLMNLSTAPDVLASFVEAVDTEEPQNAVPGAPANLTVQANESTAALTWTAPTGDVASYTVYRGAGNGCNNLAVLQSALPADVPFSTQFEDDSVVSGETYCYQISASNDLGEGPRSASAVVMAVTPRAPQGLRVTSSSESAVNLAWDPPTADGGGPLDGYDLYRCEETDAGCPMAYLAWIPLADGESYTDGDVKAGTTYGYAVVAVRLTGQSEWSNEAKAVVPSGSATKNPEPQGSQHSDSLPFWTGVEANGSPSGSGNRQMVWLFPQSSELIRQGIARVVNHSNAGGEISITAVDDAGIRYGPVTLWIEPGATVYFDSADLETGNTDKGLHEGVGPGNGDWRLVLESDLDFEVLSYVRTVDGFLTTMHDIAPARMEGLRVVTFNPASNINQQSRLRLINPCAEDAEVSIMGVDDTGASPGEGVRVSIPAGMSVTLTADALETGSGVEGSLGDGQGKWRLVINSDQAIVAINLLENLGKGHLANLSTVPNFPQDRRFLVPLFPSASDELGRQGFVRIVNRSGVPGEVGIQAHDESDVAHEPLTLGLDAGETVHLNSDDLELGNTEKGLTGSTGSGIGDWRLQLTSDLEIEVFSYVRAEDGFLTAMHDAAARVEGRYRVVMLNSGSDLNQMSRLRMINLDDGTAHAQITGVDDAGETPGVGVRLSIPVGASREFSVAELEAGGSTFEGALGDGTGDWRLLVESDKTLTVMSLLESPTGHLSNGSTTPQRQ